MKKNHLLLAIICIIGLVALATYEITRTGSEKEDKINVVTLETSSGNITMFLLNETPLHRDNFLRLAENGYYSGMKYHRVIPGFIIQIGDPKTKEADYPKESYGADGEEPLVPMELYRNAIHTMGAVSTGRQGDDVNPKRESSGSHYSIITGNTTTTAEQLEKLENNAGYKYSEDEIARYLEVGGAPHLDGGYTIFGYVLDGMESVSIIENAEKNEKDNPFDDYIIKDVKVKKMSREEFDEKYQYPVWL